MCGRFYIDEETLDEAEKTVSETDLGVRGKTYGKDIHPAEIAPVIVSRDGRITLVEKRWGYPGIRNKGIIFNARSETVLQKAMFSGGITKHRAVIPAAAFYEWDKHKEKHTFKKNDARCIYLAGFYDMKGGEERFVILTTAPNVSVQPIHDRMPLILESNQIEEWLMGDSFSRLLGQVPALLERSSEYEQQSLF